MSLAFIEFGALVLGVLLALWAGVSPTKFLRRVYRGTDVFVVLTLNGQTQVYKNPNQPFVHEDKPLEAIPHEIFYSDQYDTYYNVCWFDCGTLFRCMHTFHRTEDNALYCDKRGVPSSFIGKVLEER